MRYCGDEQGGHDPFRGRNTNNKDRRLKNRPLLRPEEHLRPGLTNTALLRGMAIACFALSFFVPDIAFGAEPRTQNSQAGAPNPANTPVRNVLLITLDTTRADHLSSYG